MRRLVLTLVTFLVGCSGEGSSGDDAGGDADIDTGGDSESDADTDSATASASETATSTESESDCWPKDMRTAPALCEFPCDDGGDNCARMGMSCGLIEACPGSGGVCTTVEEFCFAHGCSEPCCASTDGIPAIFAEGSCCEGCP